MIKTETVMLNGKTYRRTYTTDGSLLMYNNGLYTEAIDPLDSDRVYTKQTSLLDEQITFEDFTRMLEDAFYDL